MLRQFVTWYVVTIFGLQGKLFVSWCPHQRPVCLQMPGIGDGEFESWVWVPEFVLSQPHLTVLVLQYIWWTGGLVDCVMSWLRWLHWLHWLHWVWWTIGIKSRPTPSSSCEMVTELSQLRPQISVMCWHGILMVAMMACLLQPSSPACSSPFQGH